MFVKNAFTRQNRVCEVTVTLTFDLSNRINWSWVQMKARRHSVITCSEFHHPPFFFYSCSHTCIRQHYVLWQSSLIPPLSYCPVCPLCGLLSNIINIQITKCLRYNQTVNYVTAYYEGVVGLHYFPASWTNGNAVAFFFFRICSFNLSILVSNQVLAIMHIQDQLVGFSI